MNDIEDVKNLIMDLHNVHDGLYRHLILSMGLVDKSYSEEIFISRKLIDDAITVLSKHLGRIEIHELRKNKIIG